MLLHICATQAHNGSMSDASTANREAVASEVRALMGRQRVSQTRLAKVLDMSQQSLSRRLTGEQPFNIDELFQLADHFHVEVTALLSNTPKSAWCTVGELERGELEVAAA